MVGFSTMMVITTSSTILFYPAKAHLLFHSHKILAKILEKLPVVDRRHVLGGLVSSTRNSHNQESVKITKKTTNTDLQVFHAQRPKKQVRPTQVTPHETPDKNEVETSEETPQGDSIESENIAIHERGPEKGPTLVFSPQPVPTGRKQAKTLEKKSTPQSDQVKAFTLFDQGLNSLEVIDKLNLNFDSVYEYIQLYHSLKDLEAKRNKFSPDIYLGAYYQFGRIIGEVARSHRRVRSMHALGLEGGRPCFQESLRRLLPSY